MHPVRKLKRQPLPRKLAALYVCLAVLMLAALILDPTKLSTATLALVGLYTAFVGGHAATDIMSTKAAPTAPKPDPKDDEVD